MLTINRNDAIVARRKTPLKAEKMMNSKDKQPSIPLPSRYFADICFITDAFNLATVSKVFYCPNL
jgi:hypothetical protein